MLFIRKLKESKAKLVWSVSATRLRKAVKRRGAITMPELSKMRKPDVKVVILGDMNVGKTSLLHRYMDRKFKDTMSTVGGAFFLKQWGPYNISIWDTAGKVFIIDCYE